jgi:hypothetical protein
VCFRLALPSVAPASQLNDPARPQVQTFEMALGRALETAGRNFNTRVMEMAPQWNQLMPVAFPTGETAQVTGVAVRDMGLYVFNVQVPGVEISLQFLNVMANRPQFGPVQPGGPDRPVSVAPSSVVTPDPMDSSARPQRLDFRVEYRNQVRDALVDAIVDNSGVLPLTAGETLLVVAGGIDQPVANTFQRRSSPRLVLRVKAADLTAFREGKITRDEVKQRVVASEF